MLSGRTLAAGGNPTTEEIRDTKLLVFSAASQVSVPPPTGTRQLCREEARCNPVLFLWSPLVIISPHDKSVEFPKPPCWLTGSGVAVTGAAARMPPSRCSIPATQLHAGSVLGRLFSSPRGRAVLGGSASCPPKHQRTLYEDSFLCALSPTRTPRSPQLPLSAPPGSHWRPEAGAVPPRACM